MSGSVGLSLLTAMNAGSGSDLVGVLHGKGSTAARANPVLALQQALKTEAKGVAAAAAEPAVKRDVAAFRKAVATARDAKALLADAGFRKVLLTANGLGDQVQYGALASKALLSDTRKADSLASRLANTAWLSLAKTYDFANKGLGVIRDPAVLDRIAQGYAEVSWRTGLDASTPGLSKAIDFRSRAGTVTSADQILGDAVLREVVTTALGIPKQIAFQQLPAQEKAITDRLALPKLKDPAFVEQFTRRYLIQAAAAAGTAAASSTGLIV